MRTKENLNKELHVYYDLNENTIADAKLDGLIVNCADTQRAIEEEHTNIVRTTDLTVLIDAWFHIDNGWRVFIHANSEMIEVREGMSGTIKDIGRQHNILRLFLGGTFDILPYGLGGYDN